MSTISRIGVLAGVIAALAMLAATVGVSSGASAGSAVDQRGQTADTVLVNFEIHRFVRQGRRIVAKGEVVT